MVWLEQVRGCLLCGSWEGEELFSCCGWVIKGFVHNGRICERVVFLASRAERACLHVSCMSSDIFSSSLQRE